VLQSAGGFNASEYWLRRAEIGQSMEQSLRDYLKGAHAEITGFMLLKIDLPDSYEMAIVKT